MDANWSTLKKYSESKKHEEIMCEYDKKSRNLCFQYALVLFCATILYMISPFLDAQSSTLRDRKYPFFGRYYYDKESDLVYVFCYLLQVKSLLKLEI